MNDDLKAARLAKRRAARVAKAAKINAQNKALRDAAPEKYKAYRKTFYEKHKPQEQGRSRQKMAARRIANPDHVRELNRRWYQRHPDRAAAQQKRWRLANPERVRVNYMRRRAAMRSNGGDATKEQIAARVAYYGGVCAYCSGPYEHLDHAIAVARGGTNWPANLRPACDGCNLSKGSKNPTEFAAYRKKLNRS